MNDPTLQRRTRATFEKVWQNEQTIFANAVPFVPEILHFSEEIIFTAKELNHQWPKEYFHALVLGEMERLHDDENGYGRKEKILFLTLIYQRKFGLLTPELKSQ